MPVAGVRRPAAALSSPLNCVELADEPEDEAVDEREPDEEAEPELDAVWPKLDVVDGNVVLRGLSVSTHPQPMGSSTYTVIPVDTPLETPLVVEACEDAEVEVAGATAKPAELA